MPPVGIIEVIARQVGRELAEHPPGTMPSRPFLNCTTMIFSASDISLAVLFVL